MNLFKLVLPGSDVHRSRLNEDVLNSQYASPKINTKATPPHTGILFVNWQSSKFFARGDTFLIYSFPHKYNYPPLALGAYKFNNGTTTYRGLLPFSIGALGEILIDSDSTNVNIKYHSFDLSNITVIPPFTMQIRFYVFAERGKA